MQEITPMEILKNPIKMIGEDWFLITAGNQKNYNTMTASWGQIGFLWKKPVISIYVRPSRYTYSFIEDNDYFTISYVLPKHKDAMRILGKKSGRDCDKIKESGLDIINLDGHMAFSQSEYVLLCKKMYSDDIKLENFCQDFKIYDDDNIHRQYVAEIIKVYK